jgi:predicted GNAT family acetyltransferase
MAFTVQDDPAASQYELFDGTTAIGLAKYQRTNRQIAFTHTEVSPDFEGRGLGHRLIRAALDDARAHDLQVLPYCPFVAQFIADHPPYLDLVPPSRRAAFGLE